MASATSLRKIIFAGDFRATTRSSPHGPATEYDLDL
jgi:hypothetical protein